MTLALADLVPPLFGLAGGALAGFLSARAALKSWQRSRQDMAARQAVELIHAVCTDLAGLTHAAMWLTWKATHDAHNVALEDIDRYEAHSQERMPRLLGSLAALAAVDSATADALLPLAGEMTDLDGRLGLACVAARQGDVAGLAALYPESLKAYSRMFDAIAGRSAQVIGRRENVEIA